MLSKEGNPREWPLWRRLSSVLLLSTSLVAGPAFARAGGARGMRGGGTGGGMRGGGAGAYQGGGAARSAPASAPSHTAPARTTSGRTGNVNSARGANVQNSNVGNRQANVGNRQTNVRVD